ncbi:MAG TPA: aromatic ring-hydroxylating dioxygenase subunit alpha [Myxococcota bacterium]|nr:aromatic ring-hydroxylating dioxygenase subunit alpha [Myxococcota bacterium]
MLFDARSPVHPASLSRERLRELIASQPKGCALQQAFYSDPAIYALDMERIFLRRWLCVGHESRIPSPGDFFVHETAGESLIIIRGRDGVVRALLNVCRHRGSEVCYEREGNAKVLVCPYHAWAYELDGSLRAARHMKDDIDKSAYGLSRINLRILEGLIFVCFADVPPKLGDAEGTLRASLGRYGWARAKVAHRAVYSVDANWKLAIENYYECYHCGPAHPEFARHHATERHLDPASKALREQSRERARQLGIEIPYVAHWPWAVAPDEEMVDAFHDATYPGSVTGSEDGQGVAPLMGDFSDYDGGFSYVDVGPASAFLAYPDYGVLYLFIPRGVQKTDMEIVWLVDADAKEGVDYDLARLIWMWDVTSIADKRIIDHNQRGVNSRYYRPGPYSQMEEMPRELTEWYLQQIAV